MRHPLIGSLTVTQQTWRQESGPSIVAATTAASSPSRAALDLLAQAITQNAPPVRTVGSAPADLARILLVRPPRDRPRAGSRNPIFGLRPRTGGRGRPSSRPTSASRCRPLRPLSPARPAASGRTRRPPPAETGVERGPQPVTPGNIPPGRPGAELPQPRSGLCDHPAAAAPATTRAAAARRTPSRHRTVHDDVSRPRGPLPNRPDGSRIRISL